MTIDPDHNQTREGGGSGRIQREHIKNSLMRTCVCVCFGSGTRRSREDDKHFLFPLFSARVFVAGVRDEGDTLEHRCVKRG